MVVAIHGGKHLKRRFELLGDRRKEVYHRLDLRRNDTIKYCQLFEEILTKGMSAVTLRYGRICILSLKF